MTKTLLLAALLACTSIHAAEISVLSAGAVEPGMPAYTGLVKQQTGHELRILYNAAPQIAKRLAEGQRYDILVAPAGVMEQAIKDGRVEADTRIPVGRVGVGVAVRAGSNAPLIGDTAAFTRALVSADSVVYNTASTGLYVEKLFAKLDMLATLKPKTTRYADGAAVMEHLLKGRRGEIGLGAITEIKLYEAKGLVYVGPLPADIQNYTRYDAAIMAGAAQAEAARAALRVLAAPAGKAAFSSRGIE